MKNDCAYCKYFYSTKETPIRYEFVFKDSNKKELYYWNKEHKQIKMCQHKICFDIVGYNVNKMITKRIRSQIQLNSNNECCFFKCRLYYIITSLFRKL